MFHYDHCAQLILQSQLADTAVETTKKGLTRIRTLNDATTITNTFTITLYVRLTQVHRFDIQSLLNWVSDPERTSNRYFRTDYAKYIAQVIR